jgi:NAD(P)-dependent dehydrogenase (short-subunit alcohol dehydrogenase family)
VAGLRYREGITVLVTGAARNLGRACALALAGHGANVAVATGSDLSAAEEVAQACRTLGVRAHAARADLADAEQVEHMVDEFLDHFGQIDGYVANAALRPHRALADMTLADWDGVVAVNLSSAFLLARLLAPAMAERGWGRIVNTSGVSAWSGSANRAHANAAKAGLHGLTKSLAFELAPSGVTVNTVVPGGFDTPRDPIDYPDWDAQARALAAQMPVRRLGRPEEYGSLCGFLVSDEAGFINGQAIHINGGLWMG